MYVMLLGRQACLQDYMLVHLVQVPTVFFMFRRIPPVPFSPGRPDREVPCVIAYVMKEGLQRGYGQLGEKKKTRDACGEFHRSGSNESRRQLV